MAPFMEPEPTQFVLQEEDWGRLAAALDAPPCVNPRLLRLFQRDSVFDRAEDPLDVAEPLRLPRPGG